MDRYFAYASLKGWNDGSGNVDYVNVEIIADMTPEGPLKGERYATASHFPVPRVAVFQNGRRGKCAVVGFDKDGNATHL